MSNSKNKGLDLGLESIFSEEYELICNEIAEIDSLYNDTKSHYEAVKQSRSSLQFVQHQTANLISLKSNKLSLIKEMVAIKKSTADLKIKEHTSNRNEEKGSDNENAIIKNIYSMLLAENRDELIKNKTENMEVDDTSEEDIDALLEERLNSIESSKLKKEEEKLARQKEETQEHRRFVVDLNKNIYCIDDDYNLIEEAKIPDFVIEFEEDSEGNTIAVNQFGEYLEVIEVE